MPIDPDSREQALSVTGSLSISCDDFQFELLLSPKHFVADFPSIGMLLRAGRMKRVLTRMLEDIPFPLPFAQMSKRSLTPEFRIPFLEDNFIYAAANGRPVGKIWLKNSKLVFRPTPLSYFSKLK